MFTFKSESNFVIYAYVDEYLKFNGLLYLGFALVNNENSHIAINEAQRNLEKKFQY